MATIRNPIEWGMDQMRLAGRALESAGHALGTAHQEGAPAPLSLRHVAVRDLSDVLKSGFEDFTLYRTDVIFLCVIYPIAGLVLARLAFSYDMLPLLFPLASGFALIGPFAAVGLYEISRRREQAALGVRPDTWRGALGIVRSPGFGKILVLGLMLVAVFLLWLVAAFGIYMLTLGPNPPVSAASFIGDIFTTCAGWAMICVGVGVGFLFALFVLATATVSFPLLLDRDVTLGTAIGTSVSAMAVSPGAMAAWGLIVVAGLVIGSIPFFIGLVIVMPVLGHATWHLYRKMLPA
jgi:uncharacterized membrane protein